MFNSLFKKIMASYIVIPIIIMIILSIFLPRYLEDYIFKNKEEELLRKADIIAQGVQFNEDINLTVFEKIMDTGIIIIDAQEKVVYRGQRMQGMMRGRFLNNRPFGPGMKRDMREDLLAQKGLLAEENIIQRVLKGEQVSFRGESPLLDEKVIAVGVPLGNNSSGQAMFLLSSLKGLQQVVYRIRNLTLRIALLAVGLSLLIAYFTTSSIVRPIRQIKERAQLMAEGELGVRLDELPDDEIGELGRSFNHMARALEESMTDLNMEKNRMENMLNSMTEGVLGVSKKGNIILANPSFKQLFHLDKDFMGRHTNDLIPQELTELIENVINHSGEESCEFSWREKILIAQAAPVYKNGSNLWGVIVLVSDVTQIRKLAEMRELFVANVSHELKTPLTAIQGYIEAILDGIIGDETQEKLYLEKVLRETNRMSRLAGEVLELSRLQSGQIDFRYREVNLVRIINSVLNTLSARLEEREVKIESPTEVILKTDHDRIEQVLINLVDNAIKFTSQEGIININVKKREKEVEVIVSDNGQGIPEGEIPYIWERFHQVDRSRKPGRGGTGLGLAIVKEIIEGLGGEIDVKSSIGQGSSFSFTLPLIN